MDNTNDTPVEKCIIYNEIDKIMNSKKIRSLNKFTLDIEPPETLQLYDNVVNFYNGYKWVVIPMDTILRYPIIHTVYHDKEEEYETTVVICPLTLRGSVIKGKFNFLRYTQSVMNLINDKNEEVKININLKKDENNNKLFSKRFEVKIRNLRNSLVDIQDCLYLNINKKKLNDYVIEKKYYSNRYDVNNNLIEPRLIIIHPKTIVNIIQYTNSKGENKETIIVGKDAKYDIVTGYDTKKSGFDDYIRKYREQLLRRDGYVIPIMWMYAKLSCYNPRFVFLSEEK